MKIRKVGLLTVIVGLNLFYVDVEAGPTYSFVNITNSNAADAAIGEAQLFVQVNDAGSNRVLFKFTNIGPEPSSITDVYFDDGALLSIFAIEGSAGVEFSQYATPHNLPGGNNVTPHFETTAGFSVDSDPPVQPNGVNPGEWLGITFDLQSGGTFTNVIADLASRDLRIGIHVQGFASGGSESFVNNGVVIPAPGALVLGSIGVGLAGWVRRRRML
jgi:hypothetical protein